VASAATSPSSTKSRRTEPVPGPLSEAVGVSADADTADITDEAVVPDEELLVVAEEVELIDVEAIAVDTEAVADVNVVGAIEVDDDEEEDEDSTPVTAAIPGAKDSKATKTTADSENSPGMTRKSPRLSSRPARTPSSPRRPTRSAPISSRSARSPSSTPKRKWIWPSASKPGCTPQSECGRARTPASG